MADWRTMDAGRPLDKMIAQRLGLQVITGNRPDSNFMYYQDGPIFYSYMDGDTRRRVPSYSTDLNAAWELLAVLKANTEITIKNGPKGELLIGFWDKVWFGSYSAPPALSICRAVLDWLDAKQVEAVEDAH